MAFPAVKLIDDFRAAGVHAGFTLRYRLPMLAAAITPQGTAEHGAEMTRMLCEKTTALVNGALEAQKEIMRITFAAMTGRLDFADVPHVCASVAAAGMQPAFRAVKENSERLGGNHVLRVHSQK